MAEPMQMVTEADVRLIRCALSRKNLVDDDIDGVRGATVRASKRETKMRYLVEEETPVPKENSK